MAGAGADRRRLSADDVRPHLLRGDPRPAGAAGRADRGVTLAIDRRTARSADRSRRCDLGRDRDERGFIRAIGKTIADLRCGRLRGVSGHAGACAGDCRGDCRMASRAACPTGCSGSPMPAARRPWISAMPGGSMSMIRAAMPSPRPKPRRGWRNFPGKPAPNQGYFIWIRVVSPAFVTFSRTDLKSGRPANGRRVVGEAIAFGRQADARAVEASGCRFHRGTARGHRPRAWARRCRRGWCRCAPGTRPTADRAVPDQELARIVDIQRHGQQAAARTQTLGADVKPGRTGLTGAARRRRRGSLRGRRLGSGGGECGNPRQQRQGNKRGRGAKTSRLGHGLVNPDIGGNEVLKRRATRRIYEFGG